MRLPNAQLALVIGLDCRLGPLETRVRQDVACFAAGRCKIEQRSKRHLVGNQCERIGRKQGEEWAALVLLEMLEAALDSREGGRLGERRECAYLLEHLLGCEIRLLPLDVAYRVVQLFTAPLGPCAAG